MSTVPEIAPPMMIMDLLYTPDGVRYPQADAPPARARTRLADRVPQRRPVSVDDALARARRASFAARAEAARAEAARAPEVLAPRPVSRGRQVRRVLRRTWPGCQILRAHPVEDVEVFQVVWEAHRMGALERGDVGHAGLAMMLLSASERLPVGDLVGCEIEANGERWAAFVDAGSGVLVAVAPDPDVVLAGL